MKTNRWIDVERFLNGRRTHSERKVNVLFNNEHKRTMNAERKSVYDESTDSARRKHGERTVSER